MKTLITHIRNVKRNLIASLLLLALFSCNTSEESIAQIDPQVNPNPQPTQTASQKIKIALLLDTSNSMDGLIEQAKSQLWQLVNELAEAKCDNTRPTLEIALYEYGNDDLPASENYIRQVTQLTDDLDQISADLFGLRTNGGQEYCGAVIHSSLKELDWEASNEDLKIIFIAGNEPFSQGRISYSNSCSNAKEQGIVVNTIFCGDFNEGVNTSWKNGADITGGTYMSIEHNRKTVYIDSPYDDQITQLNSKLNQTYIGYGSKGKMKKEMQLSQDSNAGSYSKANSVKRAVSKSSHFYKNSSWDLVDAVDEDKIEIENIEEEALPEEMKGMDNTEKTKYIEDKKVERTKIKSEIKDLNTKRQVYVAQKQKEQNIDNENMLDNAMIKAIKEQAKQKNMTF